jgi:quercetin dioxygenase-like cupin family protein
MASSGGKKPEVVAWGRPGAPTEQEAEARLSQEGYESFVWNDLAGQTYPRHRHDVDECLWVLKGEMTFTVDGKDYVLKAGDRLYLPSGTPHTASVPSSTPVTYIVGQRRRA